MEYRFVRDYRDDDALRKSFSQLAKKTFGTILKDGMIAAAGTVTTYHTVTGGEMKSSPMFP